MRKLIPAILATLLVAVTMPATTGAEPTAGAQEALGSLAAHAAIFSPGAQWPSFVHGFRTVPLATTPEHAAMEFVQRYAPLFGLADPASDLISLSKVQWRGRSVVRLQHVHDGLPVFGHLAVIRVEPDGSVTAFSSNLRPVDPGLPTAPYLTADAAAAEALWHVAWPGRPTSAVLGVWFLMDGPRLAWRISLRGDLPAQAAAVVVDAATGEALATGTPIFDARGRVFLQNPVRDSDTTTEVDILRLTGDGTTLTGENVVVWMYVPDGEPVQTAAADTSGDFLYDPPSSEPTFDDPFAEVNGYYQIDYISDYYQTTHGYEQTRGAIALFVNYVQSAGEPYNNAFFDGETWSISLGQAPAGDFAYDADTIYHEVTHSVVDTVASLLYMAADPMGMIVFPGALHEGLSDTFAVSLTDDPDMGEYILGRNLVNDRKCPDDIMGEVHYDGEIIGGANWEIREEIGGEALEAAAYGALTTLHATASFREYAEGMMAAIEAMEDDGDLTPEQVAEVERILSERGVDVCDRIMRLDEGDSYTITVFGLDSMGACDFIDMARDAGISFPPAFQWAIDVPEDATSLTFYTDVVVTGDDYDTWVHLRAGNYVLYAMVDLFGGYTLPLRVSTADASFENPDGPVVLTEYTDPPLETGVTYYFTVNYLGCPAGTNTVSASVGFDPVENPEAVEEEPEPVVVEEEPEPVEDASTEGPDPGSLKIRGGACGCTLVH